MHEAPRVAVFVDLENVGASFIGACAEFGATQGRVCHLAVYADWRRGYGAAWDITLDLGGVPKQILRTGGKNSADISIVIDVMEFLSFSPDLQVYILATGDSDFVPLAQKLRARGKMVIGVAPNDKGIADALISACDRFELLNENKPEPPRPAPSADDDTVRAPSLDEVRAALVDLLTRHRSMTAGQIGTWLHANLEGFRYRALGHRTLSDLLRAQTDLLSVTPTAHDLLVSLVTPAHPVPAAAVEAPAVASEPSAIPDETAPARSRSRGGRGRSRQGAPDPLAEVSAASPEAGAVAAHRESTAVAAHREPPAVAAKAEATLHALGVPPVVEAAPSRRPRRKHARPVDSGEPA